MDGIRNENQLTVVTEYKFVETAFNKIDSIIDNCYRDCHNKYYHTFKYECIYDLNFTYTSNIEIVNVTISDKNMGLFELNKKLVVARQRGYIFTEVNKLTVQIYSNLSNITIHYHLKLGLPPLNRLFFIKISQSRDFVQTHCNDRRHAFRFACRQWYLYNNP